MSSARLLRNVPVTAMLGMVVIAFYAVVVIFAPLIAPYGESEIVGAAYLPWGENGYILGTDSLGRDMFSRLVWGARNTVGIAVIATALAFLSGAMLGMLAAAVGGWLDVTLSRLIDLLIAIPSLIFALLFLTVLGTSIVNLIIVIAIIEATRVFRLARAVSIDIVALEYVEAARLRGDSVPGLLWREVLPNAAPPLAAEFGVRFCFVFLGIAALSFLGLGIQPPTADWGSMVRENATLITFGDVTPLLPAAAIAILTVSINFVVDWQLHKASGLKD